VHAIIDAIENCNIVAIDEVGPMKLFSQKFIDALETALKSSKIVAAVVHWKAKSRRVARMKTREHARVNMQKAKAHNSPCRQKTNLSRLDRSGLRVVVDNPRYFYQQPRVISCDLL